MVYLLPEEPTIVNSYDMSLSTDMTEYDLELEGQQESLIFLQPGSIFFKDWILWMEIPERPPGCLDSL
jgi:hypothetical protein